MGRKIRWVLVALALAATACGGSDDDGDTATTDPAPAGQAPETTEGADFDPNATFTWIQPAGPAGFDPDLTTDVSRLQWLYPIYDTLVSVTPEGELIPMLATDWELDDDGLGLTMDLVDNATFHDGTPFDADAVRQNIERSKTLPRSQNVGVLEFVESVEAVDDHTVHFTTSTSASPLPAILSSAPGMMMSPAALANPDQATDPMGGSGPYELTRYVEGDRVEYEPAANYWDPDVQRLGGLVIRQIQDDNARLNALLTDEGDGTLLRAAQIPTAESSGLVIQEGIPSMQSYNLVLNTSRSEFDNQKVRQAMHHAIDRDAIGNDLLDGLCIPSLQLYPEGYWANDPDLGADYYDYDPDEARQLLTEAGFPDGFSFDLYVSSTAVFTQLAEVLQQQFAAVGIEANIVQGDFNELMQRFGLDKDIDSVIVPQFGEPDPSILFEDYFLPGGFRNPGGYTTPEIQQLAEEGLAQGDQDERAETYHELIKAALDEAYPNLTVCSVISPNALTERVQGLQIYLDGVRRFRGVSMKAE